MPVDINQLLLAAVDPASRQRAQADLMRNRQDIQDALLQSGQKASQHDLLNFAAGVSNNPQLQQAMQALTTANSERNKPQLNANQLLANNQLFDAPIAQQQRQDAQQSMLLRTIQALQEQEFRAMMAREGFQNRLDVAGLQKQAIAADRQRIADEKERVRIEQGTEKLAATLQKEGIPSLGHDLDVAERNLAPFRGEDGKPKNIPGLGVIDSMKPDAYLALSGQETALQIRSDVQKLVNRILKEMSGAAVTDSEMRRYVKQLQTATTPTSFFNAFDNLKAEYERVRDNVTSGFGDDVIDNYNARSAFPLPGRKETAAPTQPDVPLGIQEMLKSLPPGTKWIGAAE